MNNFLRIGLFAQEAKLDGNSLFAHVFSNSVKVDTASEIIRILLEVHGFKVTSVYRESGKSATLYKASLHAIFEASMAEMPVQ